MIKCHKVLMSGFQVYREAAVIPNAWLGIV